jgi:alkylhydroperoxidase family enzyme
MPRVEPIPGKGVLVARVLGRCPEILDGVLHLDDAVRVRGNLSRRLKETVRRSAAPRIGCPYCVSLGEAPSEFADRREELAVDLTQRMLVDPAGIDDATFDCLREEFTDEEIVELVAWIAYLVIGGQTFGAVMRLEPADAQEAAWYQRSVVRAD